MIAAAPGMRDRAGGIPGRVLAVRYIGGPWKKTVLEETGIGDGNKEKIIRAE